MKRTATWWRAGLIAAVIAGTLVIAAPALALTITGAGATFPAPLYQKWAKDYKKANVNYQAVGSGTGIAQIKAGNVNFGASDKPLNKTDKGGLDDLGLVQFPSCIGGVVPVVHINSIGSGRVRLTGAVVAQIYKGNIKYWNDSRIQKLQHGLTLPKVKIKVVHRSDSSGTTWIFTHYLKAVDSSWPFADMSGSWPTGVGQQGSALVANFVKHNNGAIGYVEFAYALQVHVPYAQMKNKAGRWVLPSLGTFSAAATHATYSAKVGFVTNLVNMSGKTSWPITGATYILVRKSQKTYATGHGMLAFFNWAYTSSKGLSDAKNLQYVHIPSSAVSKIKAMWHSNVKAGGKACW